MYLMLMALAFHLSEMTYSFGWTWLWSCPPRHGPWWPSCYRWRWSWRTPCAFCLAPKASNKHDEDFKNESFFLLSHLISVVAHLGQDRDSRSKGH